MQIANGTLISLMSDKYIMGNNLENTITTSTKFK